MSPRVSIMMPAYNAEATLPMALASMVAQSFSDWQAVIVDDGSNDRTAEIAASAGDPRIQLIRLPSNRGRPYARQVALEAARGDYLCMLDADDWMYPERIARQVAVLDATPSVAAVSAGMAIVDPSGELVGARCFGERGAAGLSASAFSPPGPPPIAHAPSMLRREAVRDIRPDLRLKRGQDTDFMMRVLTGHRFYLLPDLLYAYAESGSFTRENVLTGHRLNRTIQAKYFASYPIRSRINWSKAFMKGLGSRVLFALGQENYLLRSRSRPPTAEQAARFSAARAQVLAHMT
jgi:glycosyltransferase involved in cell wall biosynthesis